MHNKYVVLLLLFISSGPLFAYEPQFSVGVNASQRVDAWRFGGSAEFYHEKLMLGGFAGLWPRLEFDSDGEQHALFVNALTLAGMVNLEYGYSSGLGHSYGLELNSRFIPAVFIPAVSSKGDRILRTLEIFFRAHRTIDGSSPFYQTGVKLVFHFPGFMAVDED